MGRFTVEDCLCFDAVVLGRRGVFRSLPGAGYTYQWSRASNGSDRRMNCTVVELPAAAMGLRLDYVVTDARSKTKDQVQYLVEVTSTRCRFGGKRFWLRCPLLRNGVRCNGKVAIKCGLLEKSWDFLMGYAPETVMAMRLIIAATEVGVNLK